MLISGCIIVKPCFLKVNTQRDVDVHFRLGLHTVSNSCIIQYNLTGVYFGLALPHPVQHRP